MARPPRRRAAVPVERVRDEHPSGEEWRADALGASRHSRLLDELRQPEGDDDPERAARLCGEVCRNALRDLAPALVLLPAAERRRTQALAAYALTLFDFARQSGLEGERLAQINRWQFHLEEALAGEAVGQPVFLRLQAEQALRPWPPAGLDGLADAARQRIACRRPASDAARAVEVERLAAAVAASLLEPPPPAAVELGAALLRLFGLLDLGEGLRRHDARLPVSELPERWETASGPPAEALAAAVAAECRRLRPQLASARAGAGTLPRAWRRAGRYLVLAAERLLAAIERAGAAVATTPPRLGAGERLALVLRARWLRL